MLPIERHDKAVLQFSGGKDSLACLYMLRPHWDRLTVAWLNAGDAFPEVVALMDAVRETVPHFLEISSDQPAQIAEHGWPTDLLPISSTPFGRFVEGHGRPIMQPYFACCAANLWGPMQAKMREIGATLVIRGQRQTDRRKAPVKSGSTVEGIEYWFPIEDWSRQDVIGHLAEHGVDLPAQYARVDSSLDCRHCTAYLEEMPGKMAYMRENHPKIAREVARRLGLIQKAVSHDTRRLKEAVRA